MLRGLESRSSSSVSAPSTATICSWIRLFFIYFNASHHPRVQICVDNKESGQLRCTCNAEELVVTLYSMSKNQNKVLRVYLLSNMAVAYYGDELCIAGALMSLMLCSQCNHRPFSNAIVFCFFMLYSKRNRR